MQKRYRPIALSLFSGAGGLDIGFNKAGFNIVACVEKETSFCQTLHKNLGRYLESDCRIINEDIRILEPEQIFNGQIDFIIGGPPCQSFSAIGRRAGGVYGILDERGSLFEHYCRLVKHYQPQGFLFENVRGILGASKGRDWKIINEKFSELGYQIYYRILDCADYGVPQHRERLILVGTKTHNFKFPLPTHGIDSPDKRPHISAFEAIADIQDPSETTHIYPGKYGHLLAEVPPGMNYHYFTREMGYPNPIFAWRSRFSDFLYKADPEKPVRTIVAQLGAYSGPFHWNNRKFTLQEFKRLQTFPDDYELIGSFNTVLKQIGNSVPPIFANRLAEAVLQQIFGIDLGIKLIEQDEKLSFDLRKSRKAKSTRFRRLNRTLEAVQLNLFNSNENVVSIKDSHGLTPDNTITEKFFHYSSIKKRTAFKNLLFPTIGVVYRFITKRIEKKCSISVSRYDKKFIETPLLSYQLQFKHPIGDGLEFIECILLSNQEEDIPIAWDAIEDCLRQCSGYQTMMDVYGHFTEPHPIFNLKMNIFTNKPYFLLKFAKKFSDFDSTKKLYPGKFLQDLYEEECNFDLTEIVKKLRSLRFDVRVNETNETIPPGYFRCCYPFTLNIEKQVAVAWKNHPKKYIPMKTEYNHYLSEAFIEAEKLIKYEDVDEAIKKYKQTQKSLLYPLEMQQDGQETPLKKNVAEGIETIINNLKSNKYLYSILITSLVEKLVHPNQDIRSAQESLNGGYSNRSTDAKNVTPFLKRHNLTSCAVSGAESGRNFERPFPYTLDYKAKPKGEGNLEAFLGILHAVQVKGIDPFPCIVLLMALDLKNKQKAVYNYPQPKGLTVHDIFNAVIKHHEQASGNGRARLPVIAIQAVYQCLVVELLRYANTTIRNPPNRHNANDKDGWIGDVQVDRLDGTPFEGIEVKSGIRIKSDMVRCLPEKFAGQFVDRYYILSTAEPYIASNEIDEVIQIVNQVRQQTGCQVIVNGLNHSLRYYLRLISDPDQFLKNYTELIETDLDVKSEHKKLWSEILANLQD
ncbi:DNA cytosine methyltransferase [Chlorogloeopsis sp. ULAP02]|uniref:DNA cytosine methyltransferase n=1 Tax=Chlorogloeopsis sp. ULAP02 TaxID=3107926 RepID=UPI0031369619